MGCNCKDKQKKLNQENNDPEIRLKKEQEILKLKESVRNRLNNLRKLSGN